MIAPTEERFERPIPARCPPPSHVYSLNCTVPAAWSVVFSSVAKEPIMASIKEQLKPIILNSLRITDMTPEDLRDDQPLVGGELEIDSIDILQLVMEIERHFGIKLVKGNFNPANLESINALAAIIEAKMAEATI